MSWYLPWNDETDPDKMIYPEDARHWCTDHRPDGNYPVRHNSDENVRLLWIEYLAPDRTIRGFVPPEIEAEWGNSDICGFDCLQCALLYEQAVILAGHSKYGGPTRQRVLTHDPHTVRIIA